MSKGLSLIFKAGDILSHIDNVICTIPLIVAKAEKAKGKQSIAKHLTSSVFIISGYQDLKDGERIPIYSYYDSVRKISYAVLGNYLKIAIAKDWVLYDETPDTYHKRFIDALTWLLTMGYFSHGKGKTPKKTAYYLFNQRAVIRMEFAIDVIGVHCHNDSDKIGKLYERNGLSRLEVIVKETWKVNKQVLKQKTSLKIITAIKTKIVAKHCRNIIDKLTDLKIRDWFGLPTYYIGGNDNIAVISPNKTSLFKKSTGIIC